jgi:hypothetical protein
MTEADQLRRYLRLSRPEAKFVAIILREGPEAAVPFHYASLYDEDIDLQFMSTPLGPMLIDNTYLGSFAYNLLTCWLQVHRQPGTAEEAQALLSSRLKHNFKKFYAEQLLRRLNNCFTRAIFLETLLYEQQIMIPVFAARQTDAALDARITAAARLMTGLCANHELGHHFCDPPGDFWAEFLAAQPAAQQEWYQRKLAHYPPAFISELKCDWIACHSLLHVPPEALTRVEVIRGIVFGFASFAVLYSLDKSAQATTTAQATIRDEVDLRSIAKRNYNQTYVLGQDLDFIERAKLIQELAILIARDEGIPLFTTEGEFPLPRDLLPQLLTCMDTLMDTTDPNARAMSMLVAESLHGHEAGTNYLYLRSKVFQSNRDLPDLVEE